MEKNNNGTKLTLKNVIAAYVNEKSDKYGRSISVFVDLYGDMKEYDTITKWVEENKIGAGKEAGVPNFKYYTDRDGIDYCYCYFYFKPARDTEYSDLNGNKLSFEDIKADSRISLTARAYPYKYKDEKSGEEISGITHKLTSVIVMEMGKNQAYEDAKELHEDLIASKAKEDEETDSLDIPF